jgi:hypothetical protein
MAEQRASLPRPWVGRHPLVFIGAVLSLVALTQLLFALVLDLFTGISNSYTGLLLYAILPTTFVAGLVCMGLGARLYRRAHGGQARWVVDWSVPHDRATVTGVAIVVAVSASALAGATHHTLAYMGSTEFCAQVCHEVMAPQADTHALSAHARIACVECHVAPGVSGFVRAKLGGMRQTWETVRGTYHRPVRVPDMAAVPDPGVCARCHDPNHAYGTISHTYTTFGDDEKNSRTDLALQFYIGSPRSGIHRHLGMDIDFLSNDGGKSIQQVRVAYPDGKRAEYQPFDTPPGQAPPRGVWRRMSCIDCHNRTGHEVLYFEQRLDRALAAGELPTDEPNLKKRIMTIVGPENSIAASDHPIPSVSEFQERRRKLEELGRSNPKLTRAGAAELLPRLYSASVFPRMKVGQETYPQHLKHEGCFRCHGTMEAATPQAPPAPANGCGLCHSQP